VARDAASVLDAAKDRILELFGNEPVTSTPAKARKLSLAYPTSRGEAGTRGLHAALPRLLFRLWKSRALDMESPVPNLFPL